MPDSLEKTALHKKTYEVAYALFRVAATTGEHGIAETLKENAGEVLRGILAEDYGCVEKPLAILDYFVKLGMDLGLIGFSNGEVLVKEMADTKIMVAEFAQAQSEVVDVSEIFSKSAPAAAKSISPQDFFAEEEIAVSRAEEYPMGGGFEGNQPFEARSGQETKPAAAKTSLKNREESINNEAGGFLKSGLRQMAILDKIRQSGSCRMRDIQEILPDSSERTIRYDLEGLIERKLIERTGNGGPSIAYRMRQV
jgi:hypothetical protein